MRIRLIHDEFGIELSRDEIRGLTINNEFGVPNFSEQNLKDNEVVCRHIGIQNPTNPEPGLWYNLKPLHDLCDLHGPYLVTKVCDGVFSVAGDMFERSIKFYSFTSLPIIDALHGTLHDANISIRFDTSVGRKAEDIKPEVGKFYKIESSRPGALLMDGEYLIVATSERTFDVVEERRVCHHSTEYYKFREVENDKPIVSLRMSHISLDDDVSVSCTTSIVFKYGKFSYQSVMDSVFYFINENGYGSYEFNIDEMHNDSSKKLLQWSTKVSTEEPTKGTSVCGQQSKPAKQAIFKIVATRNTERRYSMVAANSINELKQVVLDEYPRFLINHIVRIS